MPPGWERDTAHETIGNSMVGDENSRPYFGEGVGRIHDQKTRSELSTMLNEFDTDDGFIEEDAGSESGSDDFEETVRREHSRFLEQQQRKKEAAATGRAWSAPARPITLSSPSSASQRKRSAERSAERVLEDMEIPRVDYERPENKSLGLAHESPREHRPKSAYASAQDITMDGDVCEDVGSRQGLQDILEDAPFVSGSSYRALCGAASVTENNKDNSSVSPTVPDSRLSCQSAHALPYSANCGGIRNIKIPFEIPTQRENFTPTSGDSGDLCRSQSKNQRQGAACKFDKNNSSQPRLARPLAYYGILGLQSKVRKTGKSQAKNRPPSAPSRIGLYNSRHGDNSQSVKLGKSRATSALLKRPRIPSGLSDQSHARLTNDPGLDRRVAGVAGVCPPRPLSAQLHCRPTSYFDTLLGTPSPYSCAKSSRGFHDGYKQFILSKVNAAAEEVAISNFRGNGPDRSVHVYPYVHGRPDSSVPFSAIPSLLHVDSNLGHAKKKRTRSAASSRSTSKKCTEDIYTRDVLCLLSEANQNAEKINSKFRYHLDDNTHSSYDIYIRVFDLNKKTWLKKPWTMKRFLGKHAYLKERVQFKKGDRNGSLSARSHRPSDQPDFNTAYEAKCASSEKSCYESDKQQVHRGIEERPSRTDGYFEGKPEEPWKADSVAFRNRIDVVRPLKSASNPRPRLFRPSKPPRLGKMRAELEQIEQLCRRVSNQVRLAKEIF